MITISMSMPDFQKMQQTIIAVAIKTEIEIFKKKYVKENSELLLRKEAAAYLKCDLCTLADWTELGLIKSYGLGKKRIYYKKSELAAALVPKVFNT